MLEATLKSLKNNIELPTLGIPALVLLIMAMFIVPLPPMLLDLLFTFNIITALIIVMITISMGRPMDFSSFPSILLLATLLRLALNVASTRVVLVEGHNGTDAAGQVIESFGDFVISGNYFVGFIIFTILMIINFIVVTKGAGRVSEVIARFTLDAMPGKQMAIDADLNAGIISQDEARKRREEIGQEADFYGSMDGASKFVRGDAIAGLLILIINIIGGLIVGMVQHDLSFSDAGKIYVLLTIGDGLVAQIPSLFLSLATAIIVTRVTTNESMTDQAVTQLANPTALFISGAIIALIGLVPGMPRAVFLTLSISTIGLGIYVHRQKINTIDSEIKDEKQQKLSEDKELDWDDVEEVDVIGLEIGYGLIPLVNPETGGQLMPRVKGVRKKLTSELGYLIHPIRIRDALNIEPDSYNIILNGVVRGKGEVKVGKELAINSGGITEKIDGIPTKEPAFGLPAIWIDPSDRDNAKAIGYTVVDGATAVATHLNKILKDNSAELLSHNETQQILDRFKEKSPKLIEDLIPNKLSVSDITKVFKNLLKDSISLKDMRTILETLSDASSKTKDPDELTSIVRPKLGRLIVQELIDVNDTLPVMTLDPKLEQLLHNSQKDNNSLAITIEPKLAESIFNSIQTAVSKVEEEGNSAVLVVSPNLRLWLSKMMKNRVQDLVILSYTEIPDDQSIKVIYNIEANLTGE
jgi:flagellar biosynthesis protein FlhA